MYSNSFLVLQASKLSSLQCEVLWPRMHHSVNLRRQDLDPEGPGSTTWVAQTLMAQEKSGED